MTTYQIYADDETHMYNFSWEGWDNVRNDETADGTDDSSAFWFGVRSWYDDGRGDYYLRRTWFNFDTSVINESQSSITKADVNIFVHEINNNSDYSIIKGTKDFPLDTGDFQQFDRNTLWGTTTNLTVDSYNITVGSQSGIDTIDVNGDTVVCMQEYIHDFSDTEPSDDNYARIRGIEDSSNEHPFLDVETEEEETTIGIKIDGAFQDKPLKVKKDGVFVDATNKQVM